MIEEQFLFMPPTVFWWLSSPKKQLPEEEVCTRRSQQGKYQCLGGSFRYVGALLESAVCNSYLFLDLKENVSRKPLVLSL